MALTVGDWLEGNEGTLSNTLSDIHNGLTCASGWEWQWYREDTPIAGATGFRYQIQAEDVGSRIKAETTPLDQRWRREASPTQTAYTEVVT